MVFYHVPYTNCLVHHPEGKFSLQNPDHHQLMAAVVSVPSTEVGASSTQHATDRCLEHCQTTDVAHRGVSAKGFETCSCTLSLCTTAVRQPHSSPGKWQHRQSTVTMQEGLFIHIPAGLCATSSTGPRYPVKTVLIPCLYEFHPGLVSFKTA